MPLFRDYFIILNLFVSNPGLYWHMDMYLALYINKDLNLRRTSFANNSKN